MTASACSRSRSKWWARRGCLALSAGLPTPLMPRRLCWRGNCQALAEDGCSRRTAAVAANRRASMGARFDLVIRNGMIIDGTGAPGRQGDVAVSGARIAAIGSFDGAGAEEIDAKGRIVTPGFVDIHTHYDGQAVWDDHLAPSAWHGVTTAVMGNCGVGFAPCRPAHRENLIPLIQPWP